MLVLTRKQHQKIRIGDTVMTVCRVFGNRVKLGIEAPASVQIMRDEIDEEEDKFDTGNPVGEGPTT